MEKPIQILVIDDDPSMTEMLKIILPEPTHSVHATNSSLEGLDLVRSHSFDLIILDLMMAEMDGIQVCQTVRQHSSVPILILSAWDTPSTVAEALNAGADDFLVKPVAHGILIAHINKVLRRGITAPLKLQPLTHHPVP